MKKIFQVGTLRALSMGNMEGAVSYGEIKLRGEIGLGTFEGMDGEMIMLDGEVYRADVNGDIYEVPDFATAPFACAAPFFADKTITIEDAKGFEALCAGLNILIPSNEKNMPHAARIIGRFKSVTYRSIAGQKMPYPKASEINESDRVSYTDTDVDGYIVAFLFPNYFESFNFPAWHLHYISRDFTRGGHVLEIEVESADAEVCSYDGFELALKSGGIFNSLDLASDDSDAVRALEKS